jgi:hypothetical protein
VNGCLASTGQGVDGNNGRMLVMAVVLMPFGRGFLVAEGVRDCLAGR